MPTKSILQRFIIFVLTLALSQAEVVKFYNCPAVANVTHACDINELRIDPCAEAAFDKPCRLKREAVNASISVDFTPLFKTDDLVTKVYWVGPLGDLEFLGMDNKGCHYTKCPTEESKKQTYNFGLPILKIYPLNVYTVKWKIMSESNQCCFLFKIQIVK